MKKVFVLVLYMILYSSANAQEPDLCMLTLSGHVLDEHDNQPLENALIRINETGVQTFSDSLGNYIFQHVCPGEYTIICKHPGCETITKKVTVKNNTIQHFEPEHHAEMLKQVDVQISQIQIFIPEPGIASGNIKGIDYDRLKGTSLGNMIKTVPGVVLQSTGSTISKPVIHGMEGNRIAIVNNFVPLEAQQWGSEHAPEVDPLSAGIIEVIRGPNSLRYNSMGGVIHIRPKLVSRENLLGGEIFTAFASNGRQITTSGMLEGRLKKHTNWFARTQGSYSMAGNIRAPGYYMNNTGTNQYNFSAITGYEGNKTTIRGWYNRLQSEIGIFSGSHVSNLTDLLNAFQQSQSVEDTTRFTYKINSPHQRISHETAKLSFNQSLSNRVDLEAIYARQFNHRQEFDAHGHEEGEEEEPALDMMLTSHYGLLKIAYRNKFGLEGGVTATQKKNTWEGRFLIPNYRSLQTGAFLIHTGRFGSFNYSAGARYDIQQMEAWLWQDTVLANPQFNFDGLSVQTSLKYNFNYRSKLALNLSTGWRPPAVNELFSNGLHHGAAAYETGDVHLKKEYVYHTDVTYERLSGKISGTASVYVDRFLNFIYLQPNLQPVLTVQGAFPSFSFKQTNALVYGADLLGWYKISEAWIFELSGMVLYGYNLNDKDYLPFMPANRVGYGVTRFGQRGSSAIKQPFFTLSAQHVFKQNNVQTNGDYVVAPNGYFLLNLKTGFQWRIKDQMINISLEGNNLLNKKYRDYLNRFRYYADEMGINFMLRVSVPFTILKPKKEQGEDIYEIY